MRRRAFLLAAVGAAGPDRIEKASNQFAKAYNHWAVKCQSISPFSPDFAAQVAAAFHELDLPNLFRSIERSL